MRNFYFQIIKKELLIRFKIKFLINKENLIDLCLKISCLFSFMQCPQVATSNACYWSSGTAITFWATLRPELTHLLITIFYRSIGKAKF